MTGWTTINSVALLAVTYACDGNERTVDAPNASPIWGEAQAWTVDPQPDLAIGVAEGDPAYQFFRVYDALRFDDGTIVVSNSGSGEIRFFDSTGRFLRQSARRGSGPGEFDEYSTMRMCVIDDQIMVEDGLAARFHRFSRSGEYIETSKFTKTTGRPFVLGCFADGSFLTTMGGQALGGAAGEIIRFPVEYHRFSPDGTHAGLLVTAESRPRVVNEYEGSTHYPFVPLTPEPLAVAGANTLFVSSSGDPTIERYNLDGTVAGEIRWHVAPRTRVETVWDRYQSASLGSLDDRNRRRYEHLFRRPLPLPDFVPMIERLLIDRRGNIWAERYGLPWDTVPQWFVFSADGAYLGDVSTPPNVTPFEIGDDYILGRHIDDVNVESVRLHRILKPGG